MRRANCFIKSGANDTSCNTTHALGSEASTAKCASPTQSLETFLLWCPTAMRDVHLQPQRSALST